MKLTDKEKKEIENDAAIYLDEVIRDNPTLFQDKVTQECVKSALKKGLTELKQENKLLYNPHKNSGHVSNTNME